MRLILNIDMPVIRYFSTFFIIQYMFPCMTPYQLYKCTHVRGHTATTRMHDPIFSMFIHHP